MQKGLLLINLGTPDSANLTDVRRYLREFLSDKRVIRLPSILRYLLLYGFILPFRAKKTAKAYQSIWTDQGSPLRYHSEQLRYQLQAALGESYRVVLGMRYGQPSLRCALRALQSCEQLTILPLYPQYASATTGSVIEAVLTLLRQSTFFPSIHIIRDFYQDPGFINALAQQIKPYLPHHDVTADSAPTSRGYEKKPEQLHHDYLLFSYHGLPSRHPDHDTYREQCLQTTTLLANSLNLSADVYGTSFQSRVGKTDWITPYTDEFICELAERGIKHLAIICPSFVTDCLETLEEIGIRLNIQWKQLSGETLTLIPCLNDSQALVNSIVKLIN